MKEIAEIWRSKMSVEQWKVRACEVGDRRTESWKVNLGIWSEVGRRDFGEGVALVAGAVEGT